MQKNINEEEIKELVNQYSSLIFKIAYCILCNRDDAEDVVQETFLKYLTKAPDFSSEEHRKAWLIKVSANTSKNMLMFRIKRETKNIEDVRNVCVREEDCETLELIMGLPAKYKIVLTLYYVEGYKCKEISEIIDINEDTVRKRLQKGRELLKKEIERSNADG